MKRIIPAVISLVLVACFFAGCSAMSPVAPTRSAAAAPPATTSAMTSIARDSIAGYGGAADGVMETAKGADNNAYAQSELSSGVTQPGSAIVDPLRKLIRSSSLQVETLEFDDSVRKLEALRLKHGGYVESSEVTGLSVRSGQNGLRSARYTLRIPVGAFDTFLFEIDTVGNVLNRSDETKDVTDSYFDIDSRLSILRLRQERLTKLLETTTDMEGIIELERELSNTLLEIEKLTGTLKKYDSLVEYTTVRVYLEEVRQITDPAPVKIPPKTLAERIGASFMDSVEGLGEFFSWFAVFIAGSFLYILVFGGIIAVVAVIALRTSKKKPPAPPSAGPPASEEK